MIPRGREGLLIRAVTRKSEVPVTVEIEGVSRRMLLQFRDAIDQELSRREAAWASERQRVLKVHPAASETNPEPVADEPAVAESPPDGGNRPAA
jgi:hypothetical protein